MASPPVANGVREGKQHVETSLSEISRRFNVDGIDDDDGFDENDPRRRGHTRNDQKDMHRMGKRQELIVSHIWHPCECHGQDTLLMSSPEELSSTFGPQFRRGAASDVGVYAHVSWPFEPSGPMHGA